MTASSENVKKANKNFAQLSPGFVNMKPYPAIPESS